VTGNRVKNGWEGWKFVRAPYEVTSADGTKFTYNIDGSLSAVCPSPVVVEAPEGVHQPVICPPHIFTPTICPGPLPPGIPVDASAVFFQHNKNPKRAIVTREDGHVVSLEGPKGWVAWTVTVRISYTPAPLVCLYFCCGKKYLTILAADGSVGTTEDGSEGGQAAWIFEAVDNEVAFIVHKATHKVLACDDSGVITTTGNRVRDGWEGWRLKSAPLVVHEADGTYTYTADGSCSVVGVPAAAHDPVVLEAEPVVVGQEKPVPGRDDQTFHEEILLEHLSDSSTRKTVTTLLTTKTHKILEDGRVEIITTVTKTVRITITRRRTTKTGL